MTSIAQIVTELVHRGELALAEELVEILHPSPEDLDMILSQDEEGGGDEEAPPENPTPLIPDQEGVEIRLDYAGEQYVIRLVVDGNVLYWSQKKKLWVDDEEYATHFATKKQAERATKKADKGFEKKYEGKEKPKPEPPPPAKEEKPEAPEKEAEKEDKGDEKEPDEKKPIPPQFQKKKDEDEEAKSQLVAHLRDAGYAELAAAISGDLSSK
jgi:hypothetical protein